MTLKRYIVALNKGVDYDAFWNEIENASPNDGFVPSRRVEISNVLSAFERVCEYQLTDEEATQLRQDPRVLSVSKPVEDQPWITTAPLVTTQSDNFSKPSNDNSNNNFVNWGLPRHSRTTNVYSSTSNPSYSYDLDGTGVDIIISDSGIQADHPEFTDANGNSRVYNPNWDAIAAQVNATVTAGWNSASYVTGNQSITSGHGTHVAGIAAGKTYGWAKNARILSLKTAGPIPGTVADVFSMIKHWHENKGNNRPTVVNMSWGFAINSSILGITSPAQISTLKSLISTVTYRGTTFSTNGVAEPDIFYQSKGLLIGSNDVAWSSLLNGLPVRTSAYDTFISEMSDAGIIIVHSAGNSSYKIDVPSGPDYNNNFQINLNSIFPGAGEQVFYYNRGADPKAPITVGSIDSISDRASLWSMKGPGVDIWAAGDNIMSAWASNTTFSEGVDYFKVPGAGWKQKNSSGTSMSAPNITGMIALYLQQNPTATPEQVKSAMLDTATETIQNTGTDTDYTNYRSLLGSSPNVAFINTLSETYSLVSSKSTVVEGQQFTVTFTTDQTGSFPYTITGVDSADIGYANLTGNVTNGSVLTFTTRPDVLTEGPETFTLSLDNGSASVSVLIKDTSTDYKYKFTGTPTGISEGSTGTINVTAEVANGTTLYWTIESSDSDFAVKSGSFVVTANAGSFSVTPRADSTSEGTKTFTVAIRSVSITGDILATSNSIVINDTSITPSTLSVVQREDKITHELYNELAVAVNELFADTHAGQGPTSSYMLQDQIRWGWGGTAASTSARSVKITASQINELINRINLSTLRTNSTDEEIYITDIGKKVTAEFFNKATELLNTARAKRNYVDPALTTLRVFGRSISNGTTWNAKYETAFTLDFGSIGDSAQSRYEKARHFFNAGGDVRLEYAIAGGFGSGYMTWRGIFQDMGTVKFNVDNTVSLNHKGISQNRGFSHLTYNEQLLYTSQAGSDGSGSYGGNGGAYTSSRLKLYGKIDQSTGRVYIRTLLDNTNLATDIAGVITQTGSITHPTTVSENSIYSITLAIPDATVILVQPWREIS
jgi:hypothetical protein